MKCYIMRGIPGCGKDRWIRQNLGISNPFVCSSDSFFVGSDGIYRFDRALLSETHNRCLQAFHNAISDQAPLVVVNNTNLRVYEIAPYYRLAEALGYDVEIIHLLCDPLTAFQRNIHAVPLETVEQMLRAIEPIPSWWRQTVVPSY